MWDQAPSGTVEPWTIYSLSVTLLTAGRWKKWRLIWGKKNSSRRSGCLHFGNWLVGNCISNWKKIHGGSLPACCLGFLEALVSAEWLTAGGPGGHGDREEKQKLHKEIEHSVNTNPSAWLGSYVGVHRDEEKIKLSKTICSVAKTYLKITV